jgi:hypothetical protein
MRTSGRSAGTSAPTRRLDAACGPSWRGRRGLTCRGDARNRDLAKGCQLLATRPLRFVRQARTAPTDRPSVSGARGPTLVVRPGGAWVLWFQRGGRHRDIGLGPYAEISPAGARETGLDARRLVKRDGKDPITPGSRPSRKPPKPLIAVPEQGLRRVGTRDAGLDRSRRRFESMPCNSSNSRFTLTACGSEAQVGVCKFAQLAKIRSQTNSGFVSMPWP